MFLRTFTLQSCMAVTATSLLALALSTHAASVIPQTATDGPVGIILEGQYTRFDSRSLLAPAISGETAAQSLVRRYAQLTASKDKKALLDLYFIDDGSRRRATPLIDQSSALQPTFRLSSATLVEELQWDGFTVDIVGLKGVPALMPEQVPLFSICPSGPQCYLLFPQFGPKNPQFEAVDTVLRMFSQYSKPATVTQRQAFLAKKPLVIRLKSNIAFAHQKDVPVEVKMLVERYNNVPPITAADEPPRAYESRPELKALFGLLQRFRAMDESEITDDSDAFRNMLNQAFSAEYAADLNYGINRRSGSSYAADSLTAADYVKAIRNWQSVEPACSVRHRGTTFVYVRANHGEEMQSVQLFPVKVVNDRGSFEALSFANYLASMLQIPQILEEVEKSCAAKQNAAVAATRDQPNV